MIQIKDVYKTFKKQIVLKGVNLEVKDGSIQVLLGANGAGKTTLINIISGIMMPDKGIFFIDNEKITIDSYKYRKKIGYVFENPMYLEKFTAKEYLDFVALMYGLKKEEFKNKINNLLDFFDLPKNKKYIEDYSKGMKCKLSLASSLIHNPKYLILDEPFEGMDFLSVQKCNKLFKNLTQNGTAILITSHQFDIIADMCDKFALLKDGVIKFNVNFSELEVMAKNFKNEKNSVKAYLENLMDEGDTKKDLMWLK